MKVFSCGSVDSAKTRYFLGKGEGSFRMCKEVFHYMSGDKKTNIYAVKWIPEGKINGIFQIIHGMVEHIGRYDSFAQFLTQHGLLVVGHDQLGHGESVANEKELGYFADCNAADILISDIHTLRIKMQEEYQNVPYFMMGHSMGSFLLRKYLMRYSHGVTGGVIMGTGMQPSMALKFGRFVCKGMACFFQWHYKSRFLTSIVIGRYNKKFAALNDGTSWLSKNVENNRQYNESPKCGFMLTLNGYDTLFSLIQYIQDPVHMAQIPKNLPLLFVSGQDDPVGDFGKGVRKVYESYKQAGCTDLTWKLYTDDRHEILNELNCDQVYMDIYNWISLHTLI